MNHGPLEWTAQSYIVRLFFIYLLVVTIFVFYKTIRLFSHLYLRGKAVSASVETVAEGKVSVQELVDSAFASRLNIVEISASQSPLKEIAQPEIRARMEMLSAADAKFRFQWQIYSSETRSIEKLSFLALMVSTVVVFANADSTFNSAMAGDHATGSLALYFTISRLLAHLAVGITVSSLCWLSALALESALQRRKAKWVYFMRIVKTTSTLASVHSDQEQKGIH